MCARVAAGSRNCMANSNGINGEKGWAEVKEERHKGSGCPLRLIGNGSFKCVAARRPGASELLPVALHSVTLEMQDTAYPGSFPWDPTLLAGPVYLPVQSAVSLFSVLL